MSPRLRLAEDRQFPVWDFGWLAVTKLIPTGAERPASTDVLTELLAHPAYRCNYMGGERGSAMVHGPFRLEAISPADFVEIPFAELRTEIHARFRWVEVSEPPEPEQVSSVDRFLDSLEGDVAACFRLGLDREDPARTHDCAWVLWLFDEYVVIGTDGSVWLLVLGYD